MHSVHRSNDAEYREEKARYPALLYRRNPTKRPIYLIVENFVGPGVERV